jgi:hypothetical protein
MTTGSLPRRDRFILRRPCPILTLLSRRSFTPSYRCTQKLQSVRCIKHR